MAGELCPHEFLSCHEYLLSEVTSTHELNKKLAQIQDGELKNIAQTCLSLKQRHINEINQLVIME